LGALVRCGAQVAVRDKYGANAVMQAALGDGCCMSPNPHGVATHANLIGRYLMLT
jgi:hypothetical protein